MIVGSWFAESIGGEGYGAGFVCAETAIQSRRTRIRSGATYISAKLLFVGACGDILSTAGACRPHGAQSAGWLRAGDVRDQARTEAKAFLKAYPKAAYMSEVERWRELPDGRIEFTMRRARTVD
jgi:hypothetical protein